MSARCRRPSGNFLKALQLDKDAVWQHLQALAPDSDERKIIRLGVESELLCTDEDSRPVPIVKTLVSKLGKPYFMTELNAASF